METLLRLFLFTLSSNLVLAQPSSNTTQDGVQVVPLVPGKTQTISPCGLSVFSYEPQSATPQFYMEIKFTSQSNVPFVAQLLSEAPGDGGSVTDLDPCDAADHTCTTNATGQICTLVESCRPAALWYISVQTTGTVGGSFTLDASVYSLTTGPPLTIGANESDNNWATVYGGSLTTTPISKFDFFYFEIGAHNDTEGTVLHIDVIPTNPAGATLQTYLNYGNTIASPDYHCHTYAQGIQLIPACEYAQGGRWYLTVVRTVLNQQYKIRLWKEEPVIQELTLNSKLFYQLKRTADEVYFQFTGLQDYQLSQALRFFAVVDNVVGGTVALGLQYQKLPWVECSQFSLDECSSSEGCHIALDSCDLFNKTSGVWYLGVRAVTVNTQYEPVSFTVSAVTRVITTNPTSAGISATGTLLQGQLAHYQMNVPSSPSGNWLNLELYVDRRSTDLPAALYIGNTPFPGPVVSGCTTNTKSCTAYQSYDTDYKSCTIQLDPCELAAYIEGVYISVIATAPAAGPQNGFWYQDSTGYTISSTVWNPNEPPFALTPGRVVTGVVADSQYMIYSLVGFTGILKLSVSGTLQNVANPTPGQLAQNEVAASIVYGPRVEGPSCGQCWNQQQLKSVTATELATWTFPTCQGGSQGVYVVIKGLETNTGLSQFHQNEFVLSTIPIAESFAGPNARHISQGVLSSTISTTGVFGDTEYWILDFDRSDLTEKVLTLRLRAHPASGRSMQISSFSGDFDQSCGADLPLGESCTVSATNKGYCTITFQSCSFTSDTDSRTFMVIISAALTTGAVTNTSVDKIYDFSFDVIGEDPQQITLGVPYPTEVISQVYTHLILDVPEGAPGTQTLIIEAYFDAGHQVSRQKLLYLYGNSPAHGDVLAGLPSQGCYCNSFAASDLEKVVYVLDRCSLQSGRYHLSLYTDALQYLELFSRVTVTAYLMPFITALPYEFPTDFRLFSGQTAVYQIEISELMLDSLTLTDKELTVSANTNLQQYNASVQFSLQFVLADCQCGTMGESGTPCAFSTPGTPGLCSLELDYCQLRPPGYYYITATVIPVPNTNFDTRQPVPFTLYASKANSQPQILGLVVSDGCGIHNRLPNRINASVASTELQFFQFQGLGSNIGARVLQVFVSDIVNGDLGVNFGNGFLPTTNCNSGSTICQQTNSGPDCVAQATCAEQATHVSLKATSENNNEAVTFQISACLATMDEITFGSKTSQEVYLDPGASTSLQFDMTGALNDTDTPAVVLKVSASNFLPGDSYTISLQRGACGACTSYSQSQTCTTAICSLVVLQCDLPPDFAQTNWTAQVNDGKNETSNTTYSVLVYPVDSQDNVIILDADSITPSVPPLQWLKVSWILTKASILPTGQGIQSSYITIMSTDSYGRSVSSYFTTPETDACPVSISNSHPQLDNIIYNISSCCTQAGTYNLLLFNYNNANAAAFKITPGLVTLSNTYPVTWNAATSTAQSNSISVGGTIPGGTSPISEVFVQYPGTPPTQPYGSFVTRVFLGTTNSANVKAYTRANGPAGNRQCFGYDSTLTFNNGQAVYEQFACTPISPSDFYVGISNGNDNSILANVSVLNVNPILLVGGQWSNVVSGLFGVNQQFYIQANIAANIQYLLEFDVQAGDVTVFYSANNPAGIPTSESPCFSTLAPDLNGLPISASPNPTTRNIPSCSAQAKTFRIGIQPTTYASQFRVRFTQQDILQGLTNITTLPWGTTLTGQSNTATYYQGTVPNGQSSNTTFIRFTMSDFSGGTTDLNFNIEYYSDGNCASIDRSFCSAPGGVLVCSTIIPACEISDGASFHFVINQVFGSNTVTYNVLAEILTLKPNTLALPQTFSTATYEHSVNSHNLQLFIFNFPMSAIIPGEQVSLILNTTTCGDVYVSGNKGSSAGYNCAGPILCDPPGCEVVEFDMCQLFDSGDNHRTDFWIVIRGGVQAQTSPIQYTIQISRTGGNIMRTMDALEMHTVSSIAVPLSTTSNCLQGHPPALPQPCCDVGDVSGNQYSWKPEPVIYVFPIEGVQLLGVKQFFQVTINTQYASGATISVWNQMPPFCSQGPQLADAPGFIASCTATSATDKTCYIPLNNSLCRLVNSHQLFVSVDQISLTSGLPTTDPTPFPLAVVSHGATPTEIIQVNYSDSSQWFRFTLAAGESLYFKVFHAQNASVWDRYHFQARLLDVKGGQVSIWNHFACGTAQICTDNECQAPIPGQECLQQYPACTCSIEEIACDSGDINNVGESTFRIEALNVLPTEEVILGRIQFDFVDYVRPLPNNTCNSVRCGDSIFYNGNTLQANPDQLYQFQLTGVAGATQLTLNDGLIAPTVKNPPDGAPCSRTARCTVTGSLSQCTILYRGNQVPYATVAPLQTSGCADGTSRRFYLHADLYTPFIQPLKNGVLQNSDFFQIDPETGCQTSVQAQFYKYSAQGNSNYLYVEITSPGPAVQAWMNPDHIQYFTFGQTDDSPYTCTTDATSKKCYFVYACNFTQNGTFYFQAGPGEHTITVTEKPFLYQSLTVGQSANVTLPTDYTQLVVFQITPVNGQSANPLNDLQVSYSSGVVLDSWLTRHAYGDASCAVSSQSSLNYGVHMVPSCEVAYSGDTWNIQLARHPETVCVTSAISVNVQWSSNTANIVSPASSFKIAVGVPMYIKHNVSGLTSEQVIYSRLLSTPDASLNLRLFKGNVQNDQINFIPPCSQASCDSGISEYQQLVWLDQCWHCGNQLYTDIFVEATLIEADPNNPLTTFVDDFVVTQWAPLVPSISQNITFPDGPRSMAFFTATMTRDEAIRLEIEIESGPGVEVAIYFDNCAIRKNTLPAVLWCFKGATCQLPLQEKTNFGGFFSNGNWSSPFTEHKMRIVVTGFSTTFIIRSLVSIDTCDVLTPDNAPFCSDGFNQALMSGSASTFLAKDARAVNYYQNFTTSFACPQGDSCSCGPISVDCVQYLKEYACVLAFGPCDSQGFETAPQYSLCNTIEYYCGKTFETAGLPFLSCGHNFYQQGFGFEDANGDPIFPIDEDIDGLDDGSLGAGWIVLLSFLLFALVVLILGVGFVLVKRAGRHRISYGQFQLTDEDFDGKEYSMM